MKRNLCSVITAVVLILTLLVGCSNGGKGPEDGNSGTNEIAGELKDGVYLIKGPVSEQENFSMAKMEVADGSISSFKYSEILSISGEEKNTSNYKYQEGLEVIKNLNEQFNSKKDLSKVDFDAISGATHTKGTFKDMVNQILSQSQKGDVYTPKYKDGEYTAKADQDSHGWIGEVKIVVRDGQIVGVDYYEVAIEDMESNGVVFDEDNKPIMGSDGKPKTETVEVKTGERKSAKNYAHLAAFDVVKGVQKLIIDNNGTENLNVDSITGATSTRDTMTELVEKALQNAK